MIRRTYAASIQALGEREIVARASDEGVGRDGLRVLTSGIQLAAYKLNPVVLAFHDPSKPVGRCTSIRAAGSDLIARIAFAPAGASATADEVCSLCKNGVLNALSIGFNPIETEPRRNGIQTVSRSELMELSVVAVPALPCALITERAHGDGACATRLRLCTAFGRRRALPTNSGAPLPPPGRKEDWETCTCAL